MLTKRYATWRFSASSVAILVAFAALPHAVYGQDSRDALSLAPGQRVRLTSTDRPQGRYEAEVVAVRPDTVRLNRRGYGTSSWRTEGVPLSAITSLEVAHGKKSNVGKGAWIGGGIGAGLGLAVGIAVANDDFFDAGAEAIPVGIVLFGLMGAGVGAIVGALTPGTRWLDIPVEGLRIEPAPGLMALRVRVPLRL